ncbi:MAG TPA: hypothetical protein V6C84_18775 [Coleofasciculaceae cyanobacterium]|jgi:hypothetical protein
MTETRKELIDRVAKDMAALVKEGYPMENIRAMVKQNLQRSRGEKPD